MTDSLSLTAAAIAACLVTAGGVASASAAVLVDLSQVTDSQSTGEDLAASYDLATQSSTANFFIDSTEVNVDLTLTAEPRFNGTDGAKDRPLLRISSEGLGIDSGLPNGTDTTFRLDETPAGSIPETLGFAFDTSLLISQVALHDFGTITDNTGTYDKLETISISVDGAQVALVSSDDPQVSSGQTVAGDSGISVVNFASPISLSAGQVLTFQVADDGDGSYSGTGRSAVLLHSLTVDVPEPGSMALVGLGGLLMLRRRG